MESPNPKFALYCGTNECARTNTLLLPLSEVSTGAVSLVIFVFYKSCSFKNKRIFFFLHFWSIPSKKGTYWSKAKLIYLYMVELFTFTPILKHIEWKLWTSIKVSPRLGTALHCTALHCTALHSIWTCTALHYTALHYTELQCTARQCSVMQYNAMHCALSCTCTCTCFCIALNFHSTLHCTELQLLFTESAPRPSRPSL